MEIKKTISLNITKKNKEVVCYDLATLSLVMGTSSVGGNLSYYGVKKDKGNRFIIPVDTVKERIKILKNRRDKLNEALELMEQVVR